LFLTSGCLPGSSWQVDFEKQCIRWACNKHLAQRTFFIETSLLHYDICFLKMCVAMPALWYCFKVTSFCILYCLYKMFLFWCTVLDILWSVLSPDEYVEGLWAPDCGGCRESGLINNSTAHTSQSTCVTLSSECMWHSVRTGDPIQTSTPAASMKLELACAENHMRSGEWVLEFGRHDGSAPPPGQFCQDKPLPGSPRDYRRKRGLEEKGKKLVRLSWGLCSA
jgi:hypothetical protein